MKYYDILMIFRQNVCLNVA